jgi:hypothetical protein
MWGWIVAGGLAGLWLWQRAALKAMRRAAERSHSATLAARLHAQDAAFVLSNGHRRPVPAYAGIPAGSWLEDDGRIVHCAGCGRAHIWRELRDAAGGKCGCGELVPPF